MDETRREDRDLVGYHTPTRAPQGLCHRPLQLADVCIEKIEAQMHHWVRLQTESTGLTMMSSALSLGSIYKLSFFNFGVLKQFTNWLRSWWPLIPTSSTFITSGAKGRTLGNTPWKYSAKDSRLCEIMKWMQDWLEHEDWGVSGVREKKSVKTTTWGKVDMSVDWRCSWTVRDIRKPWPIRSATTFWSGYLRFFEQWSYT